ncbi:MAG: response regulator [Elusimicrobia bacterium]|nr:response regulator [Elusimicrobiota bacterium]
MPYKVLMIDDDPSMIRLVHDFLQGEAEWEFHGSADGGDGWEQAVTLHPDLIILDLNLPDIGGMELCQKLKEDHRLRSVPIIMLTGEYREVKQRVKGLELGADDYITKPFDLDILMARMYAVLKGHAVGGGHADGTGN